MSMQTPEDLFVHELSDIRSAEKIIVGMLQEAAGAASNTRLRSELEKHLEQTREHLERVDQVIEQLGVQPHPVVCEGVKGFHKELQEVLRSNPSPEVLDHVIVGGAEKTEHYEILSYTHLVEQATMLGHTEAAKLLKQNLKDEETTLKKVETIGETLQKKTESDVKAHSGSANGRRRKAS